MGARECFHCKQWIEEGDAHDCWTTTETALTRDLSDDLRDAWERLRATAAEFGEQRIYASHHSIMFSRKACYFFVRPKRTCLELCVFLRRAVNAPQVRRVDQASASKMAHTIRISHRDEVEAPITDWLREAYDSSALPTRAAPPASSARVAPSGPSARRPAAAKPVPARASRKKTTRARRSEGRKAGANTARTSPAARRSRR